MHKSLELQMSVVLKTPVPGSTYNIHKKVLVFSNKAYAVSTVL